MRKIEEQATRAFINRETWSKNNTATGIEIGGFWGLRLHNNLIARMSDDGTVEVTNCGWESRTTQSRLNALCVALGMRQKVGTSNWTMFIEDINGRIRVMGRDWWIIKRGRTSSKEGGKDEQIYI